MYEMCACANVWLCSFYLSQYNGIWITLNTVRTVVAAIILCCTFVFVHAQIFRLVDVRYSSVTTREREFSFRVSIGLRSTLPTNGNNSRACHACRWWDFFFFIIFVDDFRLFALTLLIAAFHVCRLAKAFQIGSTMCTNSTHAIRLLVATVNSAFGRCCCSVSILSMRYHCICVFICRCRTTSFSSINILCLRIS